MSRKRLTQIFPFLLPLRKWQRKKFFYFKMRADGYRYAQRKSEKILPNLVFETSIPMLNGNSGFDMKYQFNKVYNLKLAAKTIDKIIIEPEETFSFWQLFHDGSFNLDHITLRHRLPPYKIILLYTASMHT